MKLVEKPSSHKYKGGFRNEKKKRKKMKKEEKERCLKSRTLRLPREVKFREKGNFFREENGLVLSLHSSPLTFETAESGRITPPTDFFSGSTRDTSTLSSKGTRRFSAPDAIVSLSLSRSLCLSLSLLTEQKLLSLRLSLRLSLSLSLSLSPTLPCTLRKAAGSQENSRRGENWKKVEGKGRRKSCEALLW